MAEFQENWVNKLEIDLNGNNSLDDVSKAKWGRLATGITTITPSASETADTTAYYDGEGFADHDVTGKAIQFAIAGHRKFGDPAQDFVASKFIAVGDTLRTLARWTDPQGNIVQFVATLVAVVPFGGAANVKQTFSFTLAANGKPQRVSNAGAVTTGDTGTH
ncbi:phage tail tube protein [Convivina praedatoris]|uniref:Capsid protein n=1 Tax=Convivina praedatoris TaxID=2880963 RepID=A0ABN8HDU7_9LACO|nr:capsid protein [Convivina sp. LMG 32447]CAH1853323.1 hypothetical protein R077815_00798 [Convivina sp. LMG 32447]CAH1854691.1 hypothetical protein LMG032447_00912 [Convivina sp. LMG 32447]